MNRFSIRPERADEFERAWRTRETHLRDVPGVLSFQLLRKGAEFISLSFWRDQETFRDWTQGEAFRKAHADSSTKDMHERGPRFSGWDVVLREMFTTETGSQ